MLFYEFSYNSATASRWTFAGDIRPTSRVIDWQCSRCGRGAYYPAGSFDVAVEGGSAFPDVLGCGAYPLLILSERAVSALASAGINCFRTFPVHVVEVLESRLTPEQAPNYFRVEIAGACRIDLAGSGMT